MSNYMTNNLECTQQSPYLRQGPTAAFNSSKSKPKSHETYSNLLDLDLPTYSWFIHQCYFIITWEIKKKVAQFNPKVMGSLLVRGNTSLPSYIEIYSVVFV